MPNVVIVLIDTLRADRLGAYGNTQGLTPFLDQLAARGTVFRNAYSTCSWTAPAVASLFTSRYPAQLRIATFESKMADDEVTSAELLQHGGYVTAGFLAHFQLSRDQGFAQGFDTWWTERKAHIGGERLRAEATAWLDQRRAANEKRPAFLYFHYLEPHAPYAPPEPQRSRFRREDTGADFAVANQKFFRRQWDHIQPAERVLLESLYDGEVAAVDAEIRLLFDELDRHGMLANAIVVITADHGEEFMEHGRMGHGLSLFNELIRIPLIMIAPGAPAGRTVDDNVSLIDVAPTIVDLVGLPVESRFEGRSLAPLLAAEPAGHEDSQPVDIIVELERNGAAFDLRHHSRGIIRGPLKLLLTPGGAPVLYDLAQDPAERTPRANAAAQSALLATALQSNEARLQSRAGTARYAPLDQGAREQLRALGYGTD